MTIPRETSCLIALLSGMQTLLSDASFVSVFRSFTRNPRPKPLANRIAQLILSLQSNSPTQSELSAALLTDLSTLKESLNASPVIRTLSEYIEKLSALVDAVLARASKPSKCTTLKHLFGKLKTDSQFSEGVSQNSVNDCIQTCSLFVSEYERFSKEVGLPPWKGPAHKYRDAVPQTLHHLLTFVQFGDRLNLISDRLANFKLDLSPSFGGMIFRKRTAESSDSIIAPVDVDMEMKEELRTMMEERTERVKQATNWEE
jgi:hypothetical protein